MGPALAFLVLICGFAIIVKSADELVDGASQIAYNHKVSPMIIGLTLVAFGTSAPEMMVCIVAAVRENSALAIGNALGSNIANIGLVLGLTLLIKPIKMESHTIKREFPLLFIIMITTYILIVDGHFSLIDGVVLLLCLALFLAYLAYSHDQNKKSGLSQTEHDNVSYPWLRVIGGIILLPISAEMIVKGSVTIALYFGVSELVIGLTIVALGTSLPEVVTSIAAARKGNTDMAIGNIIGSNMFNLIAVLPFVGLIHPTFVPPLLLTRDIPSMFFITIALLLMTFARKRELTRVEGILLLTVYVAYLGLLLYTSH